MIRRLVLVASFALAVCAGSERNALAQADPPSKPSGNASDLPAGPLKRTIMDLQKRQRRLGLSDELVHHPLDEAMRAGARARNARASGDNRHGAMLETLGVAWAKVADTIFSAVAAEQRAAAAAKRLGELRTRVERAEALLTEQQARLRRLRSEVDDADKAKRSDADAKLDAERGRVEASSEKKGSSKPQQPPKTQPPEPQAPKPQPPKQQGAGK